jgi:hypothetical protein
LANKEVALATSVMNSTRGKTVLVRRSVVLIEQYTILIFPLSILITFYTLEINLLRYLPVVHCSSGRSPPSRFFSTKLVI